MTQILTQSGGKYFAIPHLRPYVPSGIEKIVSPFFGAGHLELDCESKGIQVYGSDIYRSLINFFEQVMSDPNRVADLVEWYAPLIDRDFYHRVANCLDHVESLGDQAAWFSIVNHCSYGAMGADGGYSEDRHNKFRRSLPTYCRALRDFKAPNLIIDCCDFELALKRHPYIFAFLDPPYDLPPGVNLYGLRGRNFDHEKLSSILCKRESEWMLCYHQTKRILNLYKDYRIVDLKGKWWYRAKSKYSAEILIVSNGLELPDGVKLISPGRTTITFSNPAVFSRQNSKEEVSNG